MTKVTKRRLTIVIIVVVLFAIAAFVFKSTIGSINVPKSENPHDTSGGSPESIDPTIAKLSIPSGFAMQAYAKNVKGARVIAFDPKGRMLVSQTSEGKITLFEDTDKDGISDSSKTLVTGLNKPHGLAFDCRNDKCLLYVAEHSKLSSYDYDSEMGTITNPKKLVTIASTATDRHFTRTLQLLPDSNLLLVSVGSSCNVCNEEDSMRGRIMAYDIKTQKFSEYARGLRNSVFMTLDKNGKVFATEMGRDSLGDDIPPDEINIIEPGKNYGWPNCYGKNIHDDNFDKNTYIRNPCMEPFESPSFIDLQAHSAPLGIAFIPDSWQDKPGSLLVAYHGSWNRSEPTGYKIARLSPDESGEYTSSQDFISGWLTKDGAKLGRPVDIVFGPDDAAYISDDDSGMIYRLVKTK
jgi:glucose/arabinose dehydrogenase